MIDRNRSVENKHIYSKKVWIDIFSKHGFELENYIPTVNQVFAHIWNIGLRPLAGLIIEMASRQKEEYYNMKKEWVKTLTNVLEPYVSQQSFSNVNDGDEVEAIFVLTKNKHKNVQNQKSN